MLLPVLVSLVICSLLLFFVYRKGIIRAQVKHSSFAKVTCSSLPSNAPLDQLPKEILETIFSLLDAKAISTCVGVSKYWNYFISSKNMKEAIIEQTLSSLKATALGLELTIGQAVNDEWLVHRTYPANYPKRWLIEDAQRWRIYEFKDYASFVPLLPAFVADARLALRIRVIAHINTPTKWRFNVVDGWLGPHQIVISKRADRRLDLAYYPLEGIFRAGCTYDLITNGGFFARNQPCIVHQVRLVDRTKLLSLSRVEHIVYQLIGCVVVVVGCCLLYLQVQDWLIGRHSQITLDCQQYAEPFSSRSFLDKVATYGGYLLQRLVITMLDHPRSQDPALWMFALMSVGAALGLLVPSYGWWLMNVFLIFPLPLHMELALLHKFLRLVRPRVICTIGSVVYILLFILSTPWQSAYSYFNLKAYLIHVCFTFFTFGCARFAFLRCCKSVAPDLFARSAGMKKWINWSLSVQWWFFIMLVAMPIWNAKTNCLGQL